MRKSSSKSVLAFDQFVFAALTPVILADKSIDAKEVAWLRKFIFADGKVDDAEKAFLSALKAGATSVDPAFTQLLADAGVS